MARKGLEAGVYHEAGSRHSSQARGTAPATRCWGACDMATTPVTRLGATTMTRPQRPRHCHVRACLGEPWRTCVHLGVLAGSAGCALGAPNLFLDSVLFLSHCLDTVHHKKFSKKKILTKSNQIKSNKMR